MTIASTTPAAQSDDPVLDELIGTATNTALLPEPDAHAYDDIATGDADPLVLGGHKFTSRFILGSGRYDLNLIKATIENAGTQIVTMALRRCRTTENNLLDYIPKGITMLPNTSGARNAEEAVRIARLAREVCQTDFVKVEIEHETKYLLPDNEETIRATEMLAKEGFVVMPYMFPDPIAAKRQGGRRRLRDAARLAYRLQQGTAHARLHRGYHREHARAGDHRRGHRASQPGRRGHGDGRGRGDGVHGHRERRQHPADGPRVQARHRIRPRGIPVRPGTVTEGHAVPSSPTNAADYLH